MAASALKLKVIDPKKNELFVTFEGYEKSHFCYASFYEDKQGRKRVRPVVAFQERPNADLIHTTIWNEGVGVAVANSSYIDLDDHRCLLELKAKGKVDEGKLRVYLIEELGPEAAQYIKLVQSRSGRGIHAWYFFPGFPINSNSKGISELLIKIQEALILLLKPFGADDNSTGIERWGTNWKNPKRVIDIGVTEWQQEVQKHKIPVLRQLCEALKRNPKTKGIFIKPLKRWYPDRRVSRKITAFVAENFEVLCSGTDIVMSRKELLEALKISKTTLPELLSPWVGECTTALRGLVISKHLERWGHYVISINSDFDRLKHLAETYLASTKPSKSASAASNRIGQTITMFEPTKRPEAVIDGERNYVISQVYLKLKWHGCSLEEAHEIAAAYIKLIPGHETARSKVFARHADKGTHIYTHNPSVAPGLQTFGCRPGIAEAWLLNLASKPGPVVVSGDCTKNPKGELLSRTCPDRVGDLGFSKKENTPSQYGWMGAAGVTGISEITRTGGAVLKVNDLITEPANVLPISGYNNIGRRDFQEIVLSSGLSGREKAAIFESLLGLSEEDSQRRMVYWARKLRRKRR